MTKRLVVKNEAGSRPEIFIYDEIGPSYWGLIDAKSVIRELEQLGNVPEIGVRINSPGGDVIQATAIYNALARHSAQIIVDVDALAASAASVIAMAGDVVRMAANSYMMIHRASTIAWGNAEELEKVIALLRKVDSTIIDTYTARAQGKATREQLEAWLDAETWLTAAEAVDCGLADEIGQELLVGAQIREGLFKNTPRALLKSNARPLPGRGQPDRTATEVPTVAASTLRAKIDLARRRV